MPASLNRRQLSTWTGWYGRINGYEGSVDYLPSADITIVLLSNLQSGANWQIRERLVKIARASQPNPEYAGIAKGPFRYARTRPDPKVLSLDEGGKYVEAAIGGAVDQGAKECAGSFWKYEDEHFLATSNGVEGHDHRASLYLSIRALVSLESSGHGIACATKLSQFTPEKAGQKAGHIASLARAPKAGKAGRYTVLFDPLIFGSLTDQVGGRLSAWAVLAGLSPFGKKVGKRVASPELTLYDATTLISSCLLTSRTGSSRPTCITRRPRRSSRRRRREMRDSSPRIPTRSS